MKKLFLFLAFAGTFGLQAMAQDDDLYFVPKSATKTADVNSSDDTPAYYRGSMRSVDEYNRAGRFRSYYQKIGTDSLGNDILTFRNGGGVYPDSTYIDTAFVYPGSASFDDDFEYTQNMSRWDGFYDPWFYGYGPMRRGWYGGWYDPWHYGYYGYSGWYNPWAYGWYGGWYDPWYYGHAGWYGPYYRGWYGYGHGWYGGGYSRIRGGNPRGLTGNRTWSADGRAGGAGRSGFGRFTTPSGRSNGSTYTTRSGRNRSFGARTNTMRPSTTYNQSRSTFGGATRTTPSYGSGSFGGGSSMGGSFGGSRAPGGTFGGGRSGGSGGGHFGNGRR